MTRRNNQDDEFGDDGFLGKVFSRAECAEVPLGLKKLCMAVAAVIVLIILGYAVLSSLSGAPEGGDIPIIRAGDAPMKVKPEQRGGLDVPNKNSTIFDTLKTAQQDSKVENLLEDEEEPVQKDQVFPVKRIPEKAVVEPVKEQDAQKKIVSADDQTMPPQPETTSDEIMDQNLKEETKPEQKQKVETIKPAAGGSTYIQLASVKSEADANKQWTSFKSKNPELASLNLRVQKADLGAKGMYYRVQAGPLSAEAAQSTCAAVKVRGGSCLVAK